MMCLLIAMTDKYKLTESNFVMYAMRHYDNPHCLDEKEFHDDLKRIKYIKRLLNRYDTTGELKERLILNHIILLYNVFPVDVATRLLFYKIEENLWSTLKTFLIYLSFMPERISGAAEQDIISTDIPINMHIAQVLRNLKNENH